jgi:hypothetical protein
MSSGSVDFSVNRDQICKGALRKLGVLSRGVTPSADDINETAEALNLIVKQWMGTADFAPGLKTWTRKRGFLFPILNENEYTLGPNGDPATSSYSQTTISANEAIGQTTLSVTSTTGMTAADIIIIRCNDGSMHESTITSTGAGPTVVIPDALTVAANAGSTVYWYTSQLLMPLSIISLRRKTTSNAESSLTKMLIDEYEDIGDKTLNGIPSRYLYEMGKTDGLLKLDMGISDTTDVYPITFLRTVEDFDSASDTPDFPQVWYRPLLLQTAIDVAPERGKAELIPSLLSILHGDPARGIPGALHIARHTDPENVDGVFFEMET